MKKIWILAVVLFLAVSGKCLLFAEEAQDMGDPQQGGGMMMNGNEGNQMGGQMHKPNPMMMGMMGKDLMVAASDGGVIVLSGPRLLKYDKDLTLVKEVKIRKGPEDNPTKVQQIAQPDSGTTTATQ